MKRIFCLALLTASLAGCAIAPQVKERISGEALSVNTQLLMQLNNWGLTGRMAITYPQDSLQAKLNWLHSSGADKLVLSSGLAGTVAEIHYSKGMLLLVDGDGVKQLDNLAELEQQMGFSPPLDYMPYWVRGLLSPNSLAETAIDENGFIQAIDQNGWHVTLQKYRKVAQVWLPHKVSFEKQSLKIKLVVDQWI